MIHIWSKQARHWFVTWLKITLVSNMLLGIFPCLRDQRFTKKSKDDDKVEEFSTMKRTYLFLFYIALLLCTNLTINALISYGNTSCEISLIYSSACKNSKARLGIPGDDSMCRPQINHIYVARGRQSFTFT